MPNSSIFPLPTTLFHSSSLEYQLFSELVYMARYTGLLLALILVLICFVQSSEARKLLKVKTSTLEGSLIMKGTIIPTSSPSEGGNAVITGGKLFGIQPEHVDRNLQSVPSPGAGH
ncbi:Uncharacterized protein Adt_37177 [Abeliophyllum distichum]|uniref:Uncharacterized protein n=1 Tax=Abeliophyllum distichum TaxID=126358 RepID=A0ABD1QNA7_9LAMI